MFSAFVIVCAMGINSEVDWNTCTRYNDVWGPYNTEENGAIRAKQMHTEITVGLLKESVFLNLDNPDGIIARGFCEKLIEA
jgi:hypothetical protein